MNEKKVPTSRFGRMARLAGASLRAGTGLFLEKTGVRTAATTAEVLGNLRGLAAKVGQMASYVDGLVPEEQAPAFEASMRALRAAAPSSSPREIRATVEQELGAPIETLFAEWSDDPIASASIGQVHKARLLGGEEVAVKVQHPGIAAAVEGDLANASILQSMTHVLGMKRFDTKALLDTVKARFREELDYGREAEHMVHFARVHEGDATIRIPMLVPTHSSGRVLTTHFVTGIDFENACAAPTAEREAWAKTLWRFVSKGNLLGRRFNADPHPGNYIFGEGGVITFLDFGCVQTIREERAEMSRAIHWAALTGDEARFRSEVARFLGAPPGELRDASTRYTRMLFDPLFDDRFHMTRAYAAQAVSGMKELSKLARRAPDEEFFTMPPEALFINRMQFGFYSVVARLDVEVSYKDVELAFLQKAMCGTTA